MFVTMLSEKLVFRVEKCFTSFKKDRYEEREEPAYYLFSFIFNYLNLNLRDN